MLAVFDIGGALLFVVGCLVFYSPARYMTGVTLFMIGSVLMLWSVVCRAVVKYGPSR